MRGYRPIWFVDIEMEVEMDRHLFVLNADVFRAVSLEEVTETAEAMAGCGIYLPPFESFDVIINATTSEVQKYIVPSCEPEDNMEDLFPLILRYQVLISPNLKDVDENVHFYMCSRKDKSRNFVNLGDYIRKAKIQKSEYYDEEYEHILQATFVHIYSTLLVLLVTKNIVKQTEEKKAKNPLSTSRKRRSSYKYSGITNLYIGKISETFKGDGTRGPVRAHLRRGHVRNQRIGEGRKDVKQIFIQPVFVNADDGWIENQRKEYRIKT
jgi:hypothetical protein